MKRYFLTGLVVLLPFVMTLLIVGFVINLLTNPFLSFAQTCIANSPTFIQVAFNHPVLLLYGTKAAILLLMFAIIVLIGSLARILVVRSVFRIGDKILHRIPLFNTIYRTTKQVVNTLLSPHKPSFNQVVLVPFPTKERYSIGVVASEANEECQRVKNSKLISVLVPSSPNPITGFILMFHKEDIVFLDMKVEDAFKFVISCGVLGQNDSALPLSKRVDLSL